jgi:DNA-binding beta-propeller fold protein YncE
MNERMVLSAYGLKNGVRGEGTLGLTTQSNGAVLPGKKLAVGGQGEVYAAVSRRGLVFKRYLPATLDGDPSLERRLRVMTEHRPAAWREADSGHMALAWPSDIVLDDGRFAGFLMPKVDMGETVGLHRITNPTDRLAATGATAWTRGFNWRYLVATGANLAHAVNVLHEAGVVIGDFNESNVRVWRQARVTLLDCDSMQVTDPESGERFLCHVGRPEFTPPELMNADWRTTFRHPSSDLFALAVHLYQLLLEGEHPFRGLWRGRGEKPPAPELARDGIWALRGKGPLQPRPAAIDAGLLPPDITGMFRQAFEDGAIDPGARPTAAAWKQALTGLGRQLRRCDADQSHYYPDSLSACPWCQHARPATERARARVLTAQATDTRAADAQTPGAPAGPTSRTPASGTSTFGAPRPAGQRRRIRYRALIAAFAVVLALAAALVVALIATSGHPDSSPAYTLIDPVPQGPDGVAAITFNRDGTTLVAGDYDGSVYLWRMATRRVYATFTVPGAEANHIGAVALSPDGETLAAAVEFGNTYLWNVATGRLTGVLTDPQAGTANALAFSPDGKTLAVGDVNGNVYLWGLAGKRVTATISPGSANDASGYVAAVGYSPDGSKLVSAINADGADVWQMPGRTNLGHFAMENPDAVTFSKDGSMLAVGDASGGTGVWDAETLGQIATLSGSGIIAIAFSPDGKALAAGDASDGITRLWNPQTGKSLATVANPGGDEVESVAFTPDGKELATADANGGIYFWLTSQIEPPATPTAAGRSSS